MQRPGFWDEQEAAARISAAHARAQARLRTFAELESEVGDLGELAEVGSRSWIMFGLRPIWSITSVTPSAPGIVSRCKIGRASCGERV